ncbi:uncharacterized protein LOC130566886 [Triplophysa rosa]|uniref:uncharacterized protein LOC130566886 n=1 Tax=Triplophysa rosa TaxID=992332 RepID=UPI002545FB76|nr:uncharacterized protein LOC130566886 [Triplophysa rosa]
MEHIHLSVFIVVAICRCQGEQHFSSSETLHFKFANHKWMKKIQDLPLSAISIPGTHQSNRHSQTSPPAFQAWGLHNQLDAGIRFFDLHVTSSNIQYVKTEGVQESETFFYAFRTLQTFLVKHRKETLLLRVTPDEGAVAQVTEWLSRGDLPLWRDKDVPTLGQVRGKIVLVQSSTLNLGLPVHVTELDTEKDKKETQMKENIKLASQNCEHDMMLTYTGSKGGSEEPLEIAKTLNKQVDDYLLELKGDTNRPHCVGIIAMDFPGPKVIQTIIDFNGKLGYMSKKLQDTDVAVPETFESDGKEEKTGNHPSEDNKHPSEDHKHPSEDHKHASEDHKHPSEDHEHASEDHEHTSEDHEHASEDHEHASIMNIHLKIMNIMNMHLKITNIHLNITNIHLKITNMHLKITNIHLKITNIHLKITNIHLKITNIHLKITNIHLKITNMHLKITNIHLKITNIHLKITNIHLKITNIHLKITNMHLKITNIHLKITNMHLKIRNIHLKITNITNMHLKITNIHLKITNITNIHLKITNMHLKITNIHLKITNIHLKITNMHLKITNITNMHLKITNIHLKITNIHLKIMRIIHQMNMNIHLKITNIHLKIMNITNIHLKIMRIIH